MKIYFDIETSGLSVGEEGKKERTYFKYYRY